jgi:glycosyltransferase involved in cell wall biosynthesis
MADASLVAAVIINFKTPDLIRRAATSFRTFYPTVQLLLIDNGSHDESVDVLRELHHQSPDHTSLIMNEENRHHGPAMDQALRHEQTPFVLFLDSDCEVLRGGLIEGMVDLAEKNPTSYAIGKRIWMNSRGFDVRDGSTAHPYIRPICMLIRRQMYLSLPPFQRHGAPCLKNMLHAVRNGMTLLNFPIEDHIVHKGRGTAARHGYRLGWRGRLNFVMNRLGL